MNGGGGGLILNDTLSTAIVNVKVMADEIVRSVQEKSELVNRDLVEPLELYQKHYASTNHEILKQANTFWNTLHMDRTQMLFAKESYHNTQYQMQQLQLQYSEIASNAFGATPDKSNRRISALENGGAGMGDAAHIGIQDKKL